MFIETCDVSGFGKTQRGVIPVGTMLFSKECDIAIENDVSIGSSVHMCSQS
ncbi:MAG: hypothetical protein ABIH85_02145 [Candidatus Omnitrophota bacterium]|nr:hypothetical protein [Candidatus Omnitrophota bacterium]